MLPVNNQWQQNWDTCYAYQTHIPALLPALPVLPVLLQSDALGAVGNAGIQDGIHLNQRYAANERDGLKKDQGSQVSAEVSVKNHTAERRIYGFAYLFFGG